MKTGTKLAALGLTVLLTASLGLAQTKPAAAKVTMHVMNGTVQSISGSGPSMTVVVKGTKTTDKPVTLMLDASTTKTGDLVQGAKVNAHYHIDNGQNIATSITATAAKPAAAVKTKTSAKK